MDIWNPMSMQHSSITTPTPPSKKKRKRKERTTRNVEHVNNSAPAFAWRIGNLINETPTPDCSDMFCLEPSTTLDLK